LIENTPPMNAPDPVPTTAKPLGERLVELGLLTNDLLQVALIEQKRTSRRLGEVLVDLGFVSESTLREALGQSLGRQTVDLQSLVPDARALAAVPKPLAQVHQLFPVSFDPDARELIVASSRPDNLVAVDQLRARHGPDLRVEWRLASAADVGTAIDRFYGFDYSIEGILREIETGEIDVTSLARGQTGYSHPIVRLVDMLLSDAVNRGASDLHL
jgi:hypothetical protein